MLSESTAQLVEHTVKLAEPQWVRIKGADEPVRARRLPAIGPRDGLVGRAEAGLVGRRWEMAALDAIVDRMIRGRGGVVNVVGAPGIGKSRVAREAAALRVTDVDSLRRRIELHCNAVTVNSKTVVGTLKSGNARTVVRPVGGARHHAAAAARAAGAGPRRQGRLSRLRGPLPKTWPQTSASMGTSRWEAMP